MINGNMPGKPKHLGVPNGRMVSVGSEPEPQGGGGHTQGGVQEAYPARLRRSSGGCQQAGEVGYRQLLAVGPDAVTRRPYQMLC